MALPDRTLCFVEGPPHDRCCDPVELTDEMVRAATLAYQNAWIHLDDQTRMRIAIEAALKGTA